jgi:hypothetical protein
LRSIVERSLASSSDIRIRLGQKPVQRESDETNVSCGLQLIHSFEDTTNNLRAADRSFCRYSHRLCVVDEDDIGLLQCHSEA